MEVRMIRWVHCGKNEGLGFKHSLNTLNPKLLNPGL
jgi:hypothetical protein